MTSSKNAISLKNSSSDSKADFPKTSKNDETDNSEMRCKFIPVTNPTQYTKLGKYNVNSIFFYNSGNSRLLVFSRFCCLFRVLLLIFPTCDADIAGVELALLVELERVAETAPTPLWSKRAP